MGGYFFLKNPPTKIRRKKLLHKLWGKNFCRNLALMLFFKKKDKVLVH